MTTPSISLSDASLTTKWIDNTDLHQILEVWVKNTDDKNYLTASHKFCVGAQSDYITTTKPGEVIRLAPGQSVKVQIGVSNKKGVAPGSFCSAKLVANYGDAADTKSVGTTVIGLCGIADYIPTSDSLAKHVASDWFDNLKYGIFIHWGIYSVPAYGNTKFVQKYAEW